VPKESIFSEVDFFLSGCRADRAGDSRGPRKKKNAGIAGAVAKSS
jgi:hypothetical protein